MIFMSVDKEQPKPFEEGVRAYFNTKKKLASLMEISGFLHQKNYDTIGNAEELKEEIRKIPWLDSEKCYITYGGLTEVDVYFMKPQKTLAEPYKNILEYLKETETIISPNDIFSFFGGNSLCGWKKQGAPSLEEVKEEFKDYSEVVSIEDFDEGTNYFRFKPLGNYRENEEGLVKRAEKLEEFLYKLFEIKSISPLIKE